MFQTRHWRERGLNNFQKCSVVFVVDYVQSSAPGCVNNSLTWGTPGAMGRSSAALAVLHLSAGVYSHFLIRQKINPLFGKLWWKLAKFCSLHLLISSFLHLWITAFSPSQPPSRFSHFTCKKKKKQVCLIYPAGQAGSGNLQVRESVPWFQLKILYQPLCAHHLGQSSCIHHSHFGRNIRVNTGNYIASPFSSSRIKARLVRTSLSDGTKAN